MYVFSLPWLLQLYIYVCISSSRIALPVQIAWQIKSDVPFSPKDLGEADLIERLSDSQGRPVPPGPHPWGWWKNFEHRHVAAGAVVCSLRQRPSRVYTCIYMGR